MKLKFGIIGYGKIGKLRKNIIEELNLGTVLAFQIRMQTLVNLKAKFLQLPITKNY